MTEETKYEIENETKLSFRDFAAKRWVRITAVSVGAAIALVGAFGAGVVAGERIGGQGQTSSFGDHGNFGGSGGMQFGGPNGKNFGGPGGMCPANDPDHCAGTDRGQHDFQLPSAAPAAPTGTKS
ncbi:MAG: hypothetical protein RJA35_438 [Actinomycetota bacterium]|jgi:hypothetical protein